MRDRPGISPFQHGYGYDPISNGLQWNAAGDTVFYSDTPTGRVDRFDFDPVSGRLRWSAECKAVFGLPPEAEVDNDLFLSRVHPEDRPGLEAAVARALDPAGDGSYRCRYRAIWPDRTTRWVAKLPPRRSSHRPAFIAISSTRMNRPSVGEICSTTIPRGWEPA